MTDSTCHSHRLLTSCAKTATTQGMIVSCVHSAEGHQGTHANKPLPPPRQPYKLAAPLVQHNLATHSLSPILKVLSTGKTCCTYVLQTE